MWKCTLKNLCLHGTKFAWKNENALPILLRRWDWFVQKRFVVSVLHRKRMRTSGFLVGDVMLLTMAFKKVKRNGRKPAVQNLVYVCNINFMFMLCLCLVYEATSCVKKQKSFCACVRIVQHDWSNNRSQALFKTMDHRSRLPNNIDMIGCVVASLVEFLFCGCLIEVQRRDLLNLIEA